jgi:hypothetical protein
MNKKNKTIKQKELAVNNAIRDIKNNKNNKNIELKECLKKMYDDILGVK